MAKYRKKPIVIEAEQYTNERLWNNQASPAFAVAVCWCAETSIYVSSATNDFVPHIHTLEGPHRVSVGDYVVRGVKGEFYPVKKEIFLVTYEPAEDEEVQGLRQEEAPFARGRGR